MRNTKLTFFIICSLLSLPALILSLGLASDIYNILFSTYYQDLVFTKKVMSKIFFLSLILLAWFLYFKINYHWIKYGVVVRNLRLLGATVGFSCIVLTLGLGFYYALPAVILMFYIHLFTPYPEETGTSN